MKICLINNFYLSFWPNEQLDFTGYLGLKVKVFRNEKFALKDNLSIIDCFGNFISRIEPNTIIEKAFFSPE